MADKPMLYVCHGDDGGPRVHPCRRVQEALRAKGIEYDKEVAAHGSPIPFLRKGSRDDLEAKTGATQAACHEAARRDGPDPFARHPRLGQAAALNAVAGHGGGSDVAADATRGARGWMRTSHTRHKAKVRSR